MAREEADIPRLLDLILDVNRLDDGSPEPRHDIVILLRAVVQSLHSSIQRLPERETAPRARLDQLQEAVAWLERMSQVYSTPEWDVHVGMIVRDARTLASVVRGAED